MSTFDVLPVELIQRVMEYSHDVQRNGFPSSSRFFNRTWLSIVPRLASQYEDDMAWPFAFTKTSMLGRFYEVAGEHAAFVCDVKSLNANMESLSHSERLDTVQNLLQRNSVQTWEARCLLICGSALVESCSQDSQEDSQEDATRILASTDHIVSRAKALFDGNTAQHLFVVLRHVLVVQICIYDKYSEHLPDFDMVYAPARTLLTLDSKSWEAAGVLSLYHFILGEFDRSFELARMWIFCCGASVFVLGTVSKCESLMKRSKRYGTQRTTALIVKAVSSLNRLMEDVPVHRSTTTIVQAISLLKSLLEDEPMGSDNRGRITHELRCCHLLL